MKLIWHIIWKDIRGERGTLLFWAALFLGQAGLGLVMFHQDDVDREWLDAVRLANIIVTSMQAITGYVLVVRLVQADAITGTRMFWPTRPISPGRLLRAKAGAVLLLGGLLPVLLMVPWWLHCGLTAEDLAWAGVELLGWQLLVIVPAFLIASLTDDLGRAVMWGLLLVAALLGGVIALQSKVPSGTGIFAGLMGNSPYEGPGGLWFTRLWLCGLWLVTGSAFVAAHQFLTRRFVRSLLLAVPVAALIVATGRMWPWDCTILLTQINDPEPVPQAAAGAFPQLRLTMGPAQTHGPETYEAKWPKTWIVHQMELQGLPEDLVLAEATLRQVWRWHGRAGALENTAHFHEYSQRNARKTLALPAWPGDPETARWLEKQYTERVAKGVPALPESHYWLPVPQLPEDRRTLFGRMPLTDLFIRQIRAEAPSGQARVELEFARPGLLFEIPLKPGAAWAGQSRAYRVGAWGDSTAEKAQVQLMTARPAVRDDGMWSADKMERNPRPPARWEFEPVLVDRSDNTIGSMKGSGNTEKSGRVVIAGVAMSWKTMNLHGARVIRGGQWVASDPDWLEHSTLAMLTLERTVRVTRELEAAKYELERGRYEKAQAGPEKKSPAQ